MNKARYALCGLSVRGIYQFALPLLGRNRPGGPNFDETATLVAILDPDRARVAAFLEKTGLSIPHFTPRQMKRLLRETRPDFLVVAGPDATHCNQIIAGLEAGCEVIVEKPMVTTIRDARRVIAAEEATGRSIRVAHNFRYPPLHRRLKKLIHSGTLGRITNIDFTYNLDTWHGSSYFYRWNREVRHSGGLAIHKGSHHFDLVNWWIDDAPESVFAFGAINYYGPDGALRPRDADGTPFPPEEEKRHCPVFKAHYARRIDPASTDIRTGWDEYSLPAGHQYPPSQHRYIYDEEVDSEDTISAVVRFRGGASMNYSCNFCSPWEGYRLGINGTKARAEITHSIDPNPTGKAAPIPPESKITLFPLFGEPEIIDVPPETGGHGGADFAIQSDLFGIPSDECKKYQLVADSRAGARAIAVGEAIRTSIRTGRLIRINPMPDTAI